QENYSAEDEKTQINRPAYAIIDYKHSSSVDNVQIEQLLLYDYVISNSQNDLYPKNEPVDFYLILFSTKGGKRSGKYIYKYTYIKRESEFYTFKLTENSDETSKNKKGAQVKDKEDKKEVLNIPMKIYEKWLGRLLDTISIHGSFTPVFIEQTSKSFISQISQDIPEEYKIDVPKGSKETKGCRVYNNNCAYEPLCSMYEIYGIELIEK
ncbi:MAG: hypothetical protein QXE38_05575, partial [Candidatus Methanomethylicia archaeon]